MGIALKSAIGKRVISDEFPHNSSLPSEQRSKSPLKNLYLSSNLSFLNLAFIVSVTEEVPFISSNSPVIRFSVDINVVSRKRFSR